MILKFWMFAFVFASQLGLTLGIASHLFGAWNGPYLALLTEPDAASNEMRRMETLLMLEKVFSGVSENDIISDGVDLVSIRVDRSSSDESELGDLLKSAVDICGDKSFVVLNMNCDTVESIKKDIRIVVESGASGVHIKENDWEKIPYVKSDLKSVFSQQKLLKGPIVGSSCHSILSAIRAAKGGVDYLFVGTCFKTLTHPEKEEKDLEGPQLVKEVRRALNGKGFSHIPIFAIGGINKNNCHIPVSQYNADGVAMIRGISASSDPRQAAVDVKRSLLTCT